MTPTAEVPATRRPRRARLWRYLRRALLGVVLLAIVLRIALPFVLPAVLDAIAGGFGLTARYEALELSILDGRVTLRQLRIAAKPADDAAAGTLPEPYVELEYAHVDVDMSTLLAGTLRLHRIEVDGLDVRAERAADGRIALLEHFASDPATPETSSEPDSGESTAVDLAPPVWIDALRAQHVRVRIVDHAAAPPLDTWLETNVRVSDLGAPDRDARLAITAHGPALLDHLSVEGSASWNEHGLRGELELELQGAHPGPAAHWLASLGLTPVAGVLDAHARLRATVDRDADDERAVDAELTLDAIRFLADGAEALGVDSVHAVVQDLGPDSATVPVVEVRGVRGHAAKLPDGALQLAGFELRSVPAAAAEPAAPRDTDPVAASASHAPRAFAVDLLQIDDVTLSLRDAGFDPPIDYELEVESIALRDVVRDPERADVESTLSVRAHLPGIAEQLAIDATLTPFAVRKTLRAELSADEVTLAKLAPHLERAGLASTLRDGRLTVRLDAHVRADTDGTTRGEAAIEGLQLADGDDELAALARISVEGLAVPAAGDDVSAGEIVVRGTAVPVRRDATGALHFAGLRTLTPPPASPPPAPALETAPARGSVLVPIRLAVDALRVRDTAVSFVDETVTPPVRTATNALEVDVENLAFGGTEDAPESEASVRVRLRIDGVAEELGIRGTVTSRPGPLDVRAALQASGSRLAAGAFAPYLAAAGIEPQFSDGRLRATLEASAKATGDGGLTATARVADVSFQDGDAEPFVALDEVKADGIAIDGRGVRVASVVVTNPIVRAARDAEGALLAMGLRIAPAAAGAPTATVAPAPAEPTASTPIGIDSLVVSGAQLFWRDAAARSLVETVLGAEASLTGAAFGPGAVPTRLELTVRAGGALAEATIAGSVTLDPDDLRAQLRFDASGLVGGPLDGYLPAGNTFALQDGRLRAVLDARVTRVEAGGIGVDVAITDVDYRDGGAAEPLLALDAARLVAPRVDPANGVVMIRELSAAGTRIAARKAATGAIEVLGFAIATDAAPPPAAADAPATAPAPRAPTHRVVIEKLDVEVARARFVDESRGAGAPPIDARVRLSSAEQLVLLDDDEDELAPLVLALEGAVSPLVESIDVQLRASPWRGDPSLEADLAIRGLRGSAIPDVLPSLAERLGGDDLQDGSLTATLNASLSFQGAGGSGIDLSRGFGVEATLTDVAFRATPDGEVLAGVDEVFVDAPRVTPDGAVLVSRLEIDGVRGHVRRSADGLHVLGLTVRPPAVAAETSAAVAATPATRPAPTGPEVRVDRILVHGLDFLFEDDAADPPMAIPLNGLDVEIDGFTTRMFTEPRAVRFAASLTGGDVELPKVSETRSIITGLLGAAAEVVTGGADTVELEQRPFLDEFAIQGQMAVYPKRKGRVRASVSALEMNTFRGPAARAGIEIDEGVMDAGVELAFLGDGAAHADARIVFDRLAVDEPPGGPISRFLKLPAPLNTVIFTLRDDTGRIEIPLSFQVADAGVGGEQIARESIKALGSVLTDAVRSAPFRVTGMVTGMLGIDSLFGGATSLEDERVAVTFAPAATNLPAAERARLRSIAELLEDDDDVGLVLVHAFGPKDYERADQLANPSPEQTRALVARLRQRRADLARERTQRGAEARALIATGRTDATQDAVLRLQALDRGLGETELALDKTLELLRPGAARRADRRARDTALEIGNRRLEAVRRAILDLGTPALRERIELRRARPNAPEGDAGGTVIAIPKARQRG